jgi:hypothetical protein
MIARGRAFARSGYEFLVGDDWRVALAVVAGLVGTYLVSQTDVPAWWVLPAVLVITLPLSVWRATRR